MYYTVNALLWVEVLSLAFSSGTGRVRHWVLTPPYCIMIQWNLKQLQPTVQVVNIQGNLNPFDLLDDQ